MHRAGVIPRALVCAFGYALLALGLVATAGAQCQLNSPSGKLKHVVYVEFDNVHFTRDNPNVPSDLEQIPNLLNFIEKNGTMDAGDHTVLISHTANDILTTEDGLYSDDILQGQALLDEAKWCASNPAACARPFHGFDDRHGFGDRGDDHGRGRDRDDFDGRDE